MFFKNQENKDEFQHGHAGCIEHGGYVTTKDGGNIPNPFAEPHIISRSQLIENKIDLKQYGKVIEHINLLLGELKTDFISFDLSGEYVLNGFEADKLVEEIRRAGYICDINYNHKPFCINIQL